MIKMGIKVDNGSVRQLVQGLHLQHVRVQDRGLEVVTKFTENVFDMAQANCPVDSGALYNSARKDVEAKEDIIVGAVGYGQPGVVHPVTGKATSFYAVERHEALTMLNPQSYKWLEHATLSSVPEFRNMLKEAFQNLFA